MSATGPVGAPKQVSFTVGQKITGTVARVNPQRLGLSTHYSTRASWSVRYGVFFQIGLGASNDALCYTRQLDKDLEEYKEGDKVEGLTISKIDGEKIEVTTRPLASEAKVGQKVKGIVMSTLKAS